MRHTLVAIVLLLISPPSVFAEDYPQVVIKNEKLKFTLYEADAKKGFYRGTRFDHAGVFGNVEFAGHKIFGPWKDKHDPTNHDDIIGPCEEFGIDSPLGYDDAKVGETFLKIGVGELEKPKEAKYSFANKYKIVKPLEWQRGPVGAQAAHACAWGAEQKANGYGYKYRKTVALDTMRAEILITHSLTNTGEKPIVTDVYNHNFFNVDGDPVGPNYSFVFPCEVKAQDLRGKFGELVELKDKEFRFKDKLPTGDFVMAGITGPEALEKNKRAFEMRHAASGITIKVEHGREFAKFNVWGIKTTICSEPYLAINLKPGKSLEWGIRYTFTHDPPKK
jgi:hypothetical protein